MMSHEQQLSCPLYRNWVKAGIALKYLKTGVESFIDAEVVTLQKAFLDDISKDLHLKTVACDKCTLHNIIPCPTAGICNLRKKGGFCHYHDRNVPEKTHRPCPSNICNRLYEKIKNNHRFQTPSWKNTDSSQWFTNHWTLAQCYLPAGGYEQTMSAAETDCSGLLCLAVNCLSIQNSLCELITPTTDTWSRVRQIRNTVLHSANLQVTDGEVDTYINEMITLLQDKTKLASNEDAKMAVQKLTQLRDNALNITSEDECDLRKLALNAIEEKKLETIACMELKQQMFIEELDNRFENENKMRELTDVQRYKVLTSDLQQIHVKQTDVEARLNKLENIFETMQVRMETDYGKTMNEFKQEILDLRKSMDNSSEVESSHKLKIHSIEEYVAKKQELQSVLCQMYEDHLTYVPISPVLEKIDARVDDVFVDLVIRDDLIDAPQLGSLKQPNAYAGKLVEGYKDVLYRNGQRCKNVYIIGDAGMGKTTWCIRLLSSWVSMHKKKLVDCTDNEITISEFEIVLFVSLRHAIGDGNILDMVKHQLFDEYPEMYLIAMKVIKQEPQRCLVILDGLDEWSPPDMFRPASTLRSPCLPGRHDLSGCTVVTTTRPWKLDAIRIKNQEINRAVKLHGLKDRNVLAERIIRELKHNCSTEENDQKSAFEIFDNFRKCVEETFYQDCLPSFMNVPIILIFMVCLWFDEGKFETTLTANYAGLLEFLINKAEGNTTNRVKGRLFNAVDLENLKLEWKKSCESLPESLKRSECCVQYSQLILNLSKLAFNALFNDGKSTRLVFSETSLKEVLSSEMLTVAVRIGILSQSRFIGKSLSAMTSISFLHSTLQEYLAAVYLVHVTKQGNQAALDAYRHYCSSFEKVKEMENILLFVSGMDTEIASVLSKRVIDDELEYPNLFSSVVEDTALKCAHEIRARHALDEMENFPIYIRKAKIDAETPIYRLELQLSLLRSNMPHLECLHISNYSEYMRELGGEYKKEALVVSNEFKRVYPPAKKLTRLKLTEVYYTQDQLEWFPRFFTQFTKLRTIHLKKLECSNTGTNRQVLDINLYKCLDLESCICEHIKDCDLTLNPTKLVSLKLKHAKKCNIDVRPTEPTESSSVLLDDCRISCIHSDQCSVHLSNMPMCIEDIKFEKCHSCAFIIQPESCRQQCDIEIQNLTMQDLTIFNLELNGKIAFNSIVANKLSLTQGNALALAESLKSVKCVRRLEMQNVYKQFAEASFRHSFTENDKIVIDLSNLQDLEDCLCESASPFKFIR